MVFHKTQIEGLLLIDLKRIEDHRGTFVKTIHKSTFEAEGLTWNFKESFYSTSKKNVIRGMHFQIPPEDHEKLVICSTGKILDVVVDLRPGKDFGKVASFLLDSQHPQAIYIPKGLAHGFLSLEDNSLVSYSVSTEHSPEHDKGVHPLSIDFKWPIESPVISDRDLKHPFIKDYKSQF